MFCWTAHLKGLQGARSHVNIHSHVAIAVEDKVYSFVKNDTDHNQIHVHVFHTVSLSWRQLKTVTIGRGEFRLNFRGSAVLIEDIIYIFPYSCNKCLYAFDVVTHRWFQTKVYGTIPGKGCGDAACVLGKVMYMLTYHYIYKLDTTTMVWSLMNTRGTPPTYSSLNYATILGTKIFLFGWNPRYDTGYKFVSVFDTETNCWLPSAHPSESYSSHLAFAYNGELYVIGGRNVNDLWKCNPQTFSRKMVETKGKDPLANTRCWTDGCCMAGDRIILFHGDDLYILDLNPSLKTLCKLAVIQYRLEQSELPHNIRWELAALTTNN